MVISGRDAGIWGAPFFASNPKTGLRGASSVAYCCPPFNGTGRYRSGQTGRTVNPLAYAFAGSNPALPTIP